MINVGGMAFVVQGRRQAGGEAGRAKLAADRRRTLVSAWVAELRRRADITVLQ